MSSHSVHLIGREEEGEEEEYRQMEIASARPEVRSPLTHPSSVLETLLTGLDKKLIDHGHRSNRYSLKTSWSVS